MQHEIRNCKVNIKFYQDEIKFMREKLRQFRKKSSAL